MCSAKFSRASDRCGDIQTETFTSNDVRPTTMPGHLCLPDKIRNFSAAGMWIGAGAVS